MRQLIGFVFMNCLSCRKLKHNHKGPMSESLANYITYETGHKNLLKEFDCIHFIKSLRDLNILKKLLLKDHQQYLLRLAREHFIDPKAPDRFE